MKNRDKISGLKDNWFKGSNEIFNLGLPLLTIGLYSYLCRLGDNHNPSVRSLSKNLHVSKNTVVKHLALLESCFVIRLVVPGTFVGTVAAQYEFLPPKGYKILVTNDVNNEKVKF